MSLVFYITTWVIIAISYAMSYFSHRRNKRLHRENMALRNDLAMEHAQRMLDQQMFRQQMYGQSLQLSAPKPPDPDPDPISRSTRDLIQQIRADQSAPLNWGYGDKTFARVSPMTDKDPQPRRGNNCVNCGRPILWQGNQNYGEWRDHAGRRTCDGAITGVRMHVPIRKKDK